VALGSALLSCGGAAPVVEQPSQVVTIPATPESKIVARSPEQDPAPARGMARIAAGRFKMGSNDGDPDESPVHEVSLGAYEIDVTEVTMAQYAACVRAGACTAPSPEVWWPGMSQSDHETGSRNCNEGRSGRDDHPVNCVDLAQAKAYCAHVGKRVPTEAEWEHAARGDDRRTYPWGEQTPSKELVNACGLECTDMFRDWGFTVLAAYDEYDAWRGTAPVGLFPRGASPQGLLDMAGNVWEWTTTEYCQYPHENCEEGKIALRGGGWLTHDGARGLRATNRDSGWVSLKGRALGFRCVRSLNAPETRN
jgi:formylglycine-generating enzyme required for sulfatase activity